MNMLHRYQRQFRSIIQNKEGNEILKKVWVINNKIAQQEILSDEEREFFKTNLDYIKGYYSVMNAYWSDIKLPKSF